jgi:TP901 family phage tail tape measure protein
MALTLKVPTIFTAEDKMSSVLRKMSQNSASFASKLEAGVASSNRGFRKLIPSIGETGKQIRNIVSAGAIAGGLFAGASFAGSALLENETAAASFRTIVSDLNDTQFNKFKESMGSVAMDTKKSTIDVAKSFEMIAGLNSKFAETSDGLAMVSKAAITLAKASGDELGVASENLVGIMNQFNLGAKESNRVINVLAAGQAVGAASISQTSESYKNFGSVAASSNISLEQSVALIQTLASKQIKGAEAGTALRGVTLRLQKAGIGYASGQFKINDALAQTNKAYSRLKTARKKDNYLISVFGAENISAGKTLLNNIPLYESFTKGVTGTSESQKAAAINSNTLRNRIDELKNAFINQMVVGDKLSPSMERIKNSLKWVSENMESIFKWTSYLIIGFATFKGLILLTQGALLLYNIGLGVTSALSSTAAISVGKNSIALAAYNATAGLASAAQWLFNTALLGCPIGWIVLGIVGLVAVVTLIITKWNDWGAALSVFLVPLGLVISMVQSFRRNWEMLKKAFETGGMLEGIKAIGKVLLDSLLQPVQQLLELLAKVPGMASVAGNAASYINSKREKMGVAGIETLDSPTVAQQKITNENITTTKNNLEINVNDPKNRVTVKGGGGKSPIKVTKTNGQR